MNNNKTTDFLVIGSGIAGLSFALQAAESGKVAILSKQDASDSNTNFAQGGIACVSGLDDSFELHIKDTLEAGAGLCNKAAVEIMVKEAPAVIKKLVDFGVKFTKLQSKLELGREGGHTRNRIIHAKDATGKEIQRALLQAVKQHPNITIYENYLALDLLVKHPKPNTWQKHSRCAGAVALDLNDNNIKIFTSGFTVLCTGGAGRVYKHTTNPEVSTGDGIAMAYRAGAALADLEFVQFHPTTLFHPKADSFLISEALRGAGAILRNASGEAFMDKHHYMGSLAPRDIIARAIVNEMQKSGKPCVYLDATHIPDSALADSFPTIYKKCMELGIDISKKMIPVVPAAHYMCGGVVTDTDGRTSIEKLYAFGEVACTGVHGANRLASNSLLEAVVFGERAFKSIKKSINKNIAVAADWNQQMAPELKSEFAAANEGKIEILKENIRLLAWENAGIIRYRSQLRKALKTSAEFIAAANDIYLSSAITPETLELRNLALVSHLIIKAALMRRKSVGLHCVVDAPAFKKSVSSITISSSAVEVV